MAVTLSERAAQHVTSYLAKRGKGVGLRLGVPVIGLVAHVDTSPEMSGANVKPIVHRAYAGGDLALPDDPAAVLRPAEIPALGGKRDLVNNQANFIWFTPDSTGEQAFIGGGREVVELVARAQAVGVAPAHGGQQRQRHVPAHQDLDCGVKGIHQKFRVKKLRIAPGRYS